MAIRTGLLCLFLLTLAAPTFGQDSPRYTVWGTYNFLRVELRVDDLTGIAHVRMTNASANVVDLDWASFGENSVSPYRDFTRLPFRGSFISPPRDPATFEYLTIKLEPGKVLQGDVKLLMPDPSDGPFTHWCYENHARAMDRMVFFSLCAPVGAASQNSQSGAGTVQ